MGRACGERARSEADTQGYWLAIPSSYSHSQLREVSSCRGFSDRFSGAERVLFVVHDSKRGEKWEGEPGSSTISPALQPGDGRAASHFPFSSCSSVSSYTLLHTNRCYLLSFARTPTAVRCCQHHRTVERSPSARFLKFLSSSSSSSSCITFNRSLLRWSISLEVSRIDRPAVDLPTCAPLSSNRSVSKHNPSSRPPHNATSRSPFGEICQAVRQRCLPVSCSSYFRPFPLRTFTPSPTLPALTPPPVRGKGPVHQR